MLKAITDTCSKLYQKEEGEFLQYTAQVGKLKYELNNAAVSGSADRRMVWDEVCTASRGIIDFYDIRRKGIWLETTFLVLKNGIIIGVGDMLDDPDDRPDPNEPALPSIPEIDASFSNTTGKVLGDLLSPDEIERNKAWTDYLLNLPPACRHASTNSDVQPF